MNDVVARGERLLPAHRALLEQWRRRMNLVGPGSIEPHYQDADRALADLQLEGRWVDLGSGAGFPGVVMAARYPELELELVESRQKRCVFLREALGRAGVTSVLVRQTRLESLDDGVYDGVTSRALAAPATMLEHARRLLRPGGQLLLFLQRDAPTPTAEDYEVVTTREYEAGGKARRSVLLRYTA